MDSVVFGVDVLGAIGGIVVAWVTSVVLFILLMGTSFLFVYLFDKFFGL